MRQHFDCSSQNNKNNSENKKQNSSESQIDDYCQFIPPTPLLKPLQCPMLQEDNFEVLGNFVLQESGEQFQFIDSYKDPVATFDVLPEIEKMSTDFFIKMKMEKKIRERSNSFFEYENALDYQHKVTNMEKYRFQKFYKKNNMEIKESSYNEQ